MKKDKLLVSKIGKGGFSLAQKNISPQEVFLGYPPLEVPYGDEVNIELDSVAELDHALAWLLWSDAHPPRIDSLYGRSIFFAICFESRDQKNEFLHSCDLYRIGDKYITGEDFAGAFGIDLETGLRNKVTKKSGMSFSKASLTLSSSLSFGQSSLSFGKKEKKTEISEHLKKLRSNEKELAKLMEWRADPEYWICLAFRSEKEKTNMLKALDLELEFGGKYLWCHDVAKSLGVELIPCPYKNKDTYSGSDKQIESMISDKL